MQDIQTRARELIDWIHGTHRFSEKHELNNIRKLLALLDHPERRFKSLHIAGTNGKGSVCAFLERALRENGYRTGLYTSPYLIRYEERIRIDGTPVSDELLVAQGQRVYDAAQHLAREEVYPTTFELGTALAFLIFAESHVDVAVIEVGLGGRLDPTNVILPDVCAIANIGMDHMDVLGNTLEAIAREKAGIIKPHVPVALYPLNDSVLHVILETCTQNQAPLLNTGLIQPTDIRLEAKRASFHADIPGFGPLSIVHNLSGEHQIYNALLALSTLSLLKDRGVPLDTEKTLRGIEQARWPGRLSWINDRLLVDGAHNQQGAQALVDYIRRFLQGRRIVLLTAMMKDKRPDICASILSPIAAHVVATQVDWPRAMPSNELAALYSNLGVSTTSEPNIMAALEKAHTMLAKGDLCLVCGSLYLVGEVMSMFE